LRFESHYSVWLNGLQTRNNAIVFDGSRHFYAQAEAV
jgi:hypothetical protein